MEAVSIVGNIAASCLRRIWSGRPGRKASYVRYERSQPRHMRFFCHGVAWIGARSEMHRMAFSVSADEESISATG
jgi:hypothetical protein